MPDVIVCDEDAFPYATQMAGTVEQRWDVGIKFPFQILFNSICFL